MSLNYSGPMPSPTRTHSRSLRILCVDDHAMLRSSLAKLLTLEGHSVRHAGDGHEAWEQISNDLTSVDVIITDNDMPRMNGVTFVERIRRANFRGAIIVHSAALKAAEIHSYRQSGIDAFVPKGRGADALLTTLEESCRA